MILSNDSLSCLVNFRERQRFWDGNSSFYRKQQACYRSCCSSKCLVLCRFIHWKVSNKSWILIFFIGNESRVFFEWNGCGFPSLLEKKKKRKEQCLRWIIHVGPYMCALYYLKSQSMFFLIWLVLPSLFLLTATSLHLHYTNERTTQSALSLGWEHVII